MTIDNQRSPVGADLRVELSPDRHDVLIGVLRPRMNDCVCKGVLRCHWAATQGRPYEQFDEDNKPRLALKSLRFQHEAEGSIRCDYRLTKRCL